jgi:hypothetical protein
MQRGRIGHRLEGEANDCGRRCGFTRSSPNLPRSEFAGGVACAYLRGDAALIAATIGDRLLLAENGAIRMQTNAEVAKFFTGYFKRVRYRQWRDVSPPVVSISPDEEMAWMAVGVEAKYTASDKPEAGERTFKSSWIATYQRDKCAWRMSGIASDMAD